MSAGANLGREALAALLDLATARVCAAHRGMPAANPAVLHFSKGRFGKYGELPTAADFRAFGSVVDAARLDGAVSAELGDEEASTPRLRKITCLSAERLAAYLGVTPYWTQVEAAERALAPYQTRWPVLGDVVSAWWDQKSPNGLKPVNHRDLVDAARALDEAGGVEVPARRHSARLFGDSKRVESITRELDILSAGTLRGERREAAQVLSDVGLVKFPQVVLMSNATLILQGGGKLDSQWPFVGSAPDAVESAKLLPQVSVLLTVENLTTFNEIARASGNTTKHIAALYTGGAPSPSLLAFLTRSLRHLRPGIQVYHWGDVDLGGFRIAEKIAQCCDGWGVTLRLWQMPPERLPAGYPAQMMDKTETRQIREIIQRRGWADAGALLVEQEALDPSVPQSEAP